MLVIAFGKWSDVPPLSHLTDAEVVKLDLTEDVQTMWARLEANGIAAVENRHRKLYESSREVEERLEVEPDD